MKRIATAFLVFSRPLRSNFAYSFLMIAMFGWPLGAAASGLDVQLKDLRGAFYHREGEKPAKRSSCTKLTYLEIKKFGRLAHCEPQDKLVECRTNTNETLLVFEALDACNRSLNSANAKVP